MNKSIFRRLWTIEDEQFVIDTTGVLSPETIAARLNRTVSAVQTRTSELRSAGRIPRGPKFIKMKSPQTIGMTTHSSAAAAPVEECIEIQTLLWLVRQAWEEGLTVSIKGLGQFTRTVS
jgi:hypothetical protein